MKFFILFFSVMPVTWQEMYIIHCLKHLWTRVTWTGKKLKITLRKCRTRDVTLVMSGVNASQCHLSAFNFIHYLWKQIILDCFHVIMYLNWGRRTIHNIKILCNFQLLRIFRYFFERIYLIPTVMFDIWFFMFLTFRGS